MFRFKPLFAASLAFALIPTSLSLFGCGGDLNELTSSRSVPLNGAQVTTPTTSTATATANVVVAADRQSITVITQAVGLTDISSAHIHGGLTGTAGLMGADAPIIFTLFDSAGGASNGSITRTLASPNLTQQTAVGISTFDDAVSAILAGRAYVDFHTSAFPNGEIRGQILPASFTAQLSGENEVPPSGITATGSATVSIDPAACTLSVAGSAAGLTAGTVTQADIQIGSNTENGPIIFPVFNVLQQPFTGTFSRTLTATDLVVQKDQGIETCFDAINAVITGDAYLNIRTLAQPNGAIRGQFLPTPNR